MLPAILFTAAVCDIPQWAEKEIRNLQEQFLWRNSTSVEPSRHKVSVGLLYTSRGAGGVGLVSTLIAVETQSVKYAILWFTQR